MSSPSTLLSASSIETLDFSLPSYSGSIEGSKIKESTKFSNPFEEARRQADREKQKAVERATRRTEVKEEKVSVDTLEKLWEEAVQADDEAKEAEGKAAAEQPKAAAEQPEVAAEQPKVDNEARRQAELEKQKIAVERATKRMGVTEQKVSVDKLEEVRCNGAISHCCWFSAVSCIGDAVYLFARIQDPEIAGSENSGHAKV